MTPADADLDRLVEACFRDPLNADSLTRFYDAFRPFVMAILISLAPPGARLNEDATIRETGCQPAETPRKRVPLVWDQELA